MTIHDTDDTLRSDRTPEFAQRVDGEHWRLSWLPEHPLSREQAWAGMELDELASDLTAAHDRLVHAQISARADILGIMWQQALIKLAKNMAARERGEQPGRSFHDPPAPVLRWRSAQLTGGPSPRVNYG
ncbi:hypothetical protein [Nocardia lasii]|uniref:Uncharacterized protein n=1 Tax=Nocardia lasii TaxID=1616107 RepID=A0ABW1JMX4_9NOCA